MELIYVAMKSKALVMEGPEQFEQRIINIPDPGPEDVLLRVELSGICGTDIEINNGGMDIDYPIVPGHEFAGRIEEMGSKVEYDYCGREIQEGDAIAVCPYYVVGGDWYSRNMPTRKVLATTKTFGLNNYEDNHPGGMNQYITLPPETPYYRLPDDMDVELGALVEPLSVGIHAVERALQPGLPDAREGLGIGHTVAVQGAGPIGLLTIAAANATGAGQIIALDALNDRLELASDFGATDTINIAEFEDDAAMIDAAKRRTLGDVGPDVVIEAAGVPSTIPQAIDLVHEGGTIIELGHFAYTGDIEINPTKIVQKEIDIMGSHASPPSQFEAAVSLLNTERDDIPFANLLNYSVGLEEAPEAYHIQERGDAYRATVHPFDK
jgi:L-iditol 2-dehydrogenase